jgi:hypothetical protein
LQFVESVSVKRDKEEEEIVGNDDLLILFNDFENEIARREEIKLKDSKLNPSKSFHLGIIPLCLGLHVNRVPKKLYLRESSC